MQKRLMKGILAALFLSLVSLSARASVVINGTRVIYAESEKEVTVKLNNDGHSPVLIQSWLDNGNVNARPDNIDVPFIITPPINRIDPGKSQTLRVTYSAGGLPSDRESIFWLNVLEIPQTKADTAQNRLQVAFRSRIKLFFRPLGISGNATEAAESLFLSVKDGHLLAENRSPFFVSLLSVTINHAGKRVTIDGEMIAPFSSRNFFVKFVQVSAGDSVNYEYINDWGAVKGRETML